MRQKPAHMMSVAQRKMSSQEEINKRLSLPADLKLPDNFVEKLAVSPTLDGPLSRATRRQSLSEIGKGEIHLNVQETKEVAIPPWPYPGGSVQVVSSWISRKDFGNY